MSPSPYAAENDTVPTCPQVFALSDMLELDDLLPIEQEELLKSFSSLSYSSFTSESQRNVTFGGIQSIHYIESSRDMTDEDVEDRWFTRSQLYDFKRAARTLCKEELSGKDIGCDESTRGMDVYFPARQKTHSKYIHHVMEAYHVQCQGNPEHVAQLCEKWGTKSRDRAAVAGVQDFYHAYFPHMVSMAQVGASKPTRPTPIQRPNKRSASMDPMVPQRNRSL